MTDFNRLQAINAELMAYRNGWISYDGEHVRRLQAERAAIMDTAHDCAADSQRNDGLSEVSNFDWY